MEKLNQTLTKKLFIRGTMTCLTGLHIGDSKENVEIGGVDLPVIKDVHGRPFVAGSSLKGKMRCLLEQSVGSLTVNNPKHRIGKLFGALDSKDGIASRLIVRDANLTPEWEKKLKDSPFTDMPYIEVKFENTINRISGTAEHPRQRERVPAGAMFDVEFVINIFVGEGEDGTAIEKELLDTFHKGIEILEDDYLGGSGSRGYGKVKFDLQVPETKTYTLQEAPIYA